MVSCERAQRITVLVAERALSERTWELDEVEHGAVRHTKGCEADVCMEIGDIAHQALASTIGDWGEDCALAIKLALDYWREGKLEKV